MCMCVCMSELLVTSLPKADFYHFDVFALLAIDTCTHGDLRLVGDDDCDEGLVEVCVFHWGT